MYISKGYILETSEGGRFAKVQGFQGQVYTNVLLVYPFGFKSNIGSDDNSLCLLLCGTGSSTNAFAIPYNVISSPELDNEEVFIGSLKLGNKITFKKDSSIVIESGSTKILLSKDGNITTTTPLADFSGSVNVATSYKVGSVQVVGSQQPAIPNPVVGLPQLHAAVDAILIALRAHGLIAP